MDAVLCAVPCGQKTVCTSKNKTKRKKRSEPASSDDDHELQLATLSYN